MIKENVLPRDRNGSPINLLPLVDSHDVDGTLASEQSDVIDGHIVRILSLDNQIRFLIGDNPEAQIGSPGISAMDQIYQPIEPGQKVAILGGKANICTVGV